MGYIKKSERSTEEWTLIHLKERTAERDAAVEELAQKRTELETVRSELGDVLELLLRSPPHLGCGRHA